jgi:hypothetical protein
MKGSEVSAPGLLSMVLPSILPVFVFRIRAALQYFVAGLDLPAALAAKTILCDTHRARSGKQA